jgi:phosphatidate cytidylyltransferase
MTAKQTDPRWSDLWTRTVSALVLAPLAIFCVWQGSFAWELLLLVAMAGLGWEWGRLARLERPYLLAISLGLVWLAEVAGGPLAGLLALPLLWLGASAWCGRFAGYGIPYAGLGGIALIWLRQQPAGLADTIFLVMVVWGTDVGAYLTGRLVGGPKLAPKISPGKTWSGSIGGLLTAAAVGALLAGGAQGFPPAAFAAGAVLSLCAQAGDLLESAIKRRLGVKDSGRTIPGHGGLFDRLDGFLAAAPVAAVLAYCVQGGVPLWQ